MSAAAQGSFFSEFLNYGGLGLLALLCLIVLGQNAWNLNALVKAAVPERLTAAKPLLLSQMGLSAVGLLFVGAGAIYLAQLDMDTKRERRAVVVLDPWERNLTDSSRPTVTVGEATYSGRPIKINCAAGEPTYVSIDFKPYIDHLVTASMANRQRLLPISQAGE